MVVLLNKLAVFATLLALSALLPVFCQTGEDYPESNDIDGASTHEPPTPPATFPPVTAGGMSYNLPSHLAGIGEGRDCFGKFPHLKRRFSPEQLEFFCQQRRLYDDIVFSNRSYDPFTPYQAAWIDSLKETWNSSDVVKVTRKEIRQLTHKEWRRFSNAIRYMKGTLIDGVSHYDLIVMLSHPALAPGAQIGAAFLPWHREYLRILDAALRYYHPLNTVPYWDSTLDQPLENPTDSILWSPLLFGNHDDLVTSGPFRMFLFRSEPDAIGVPLRRAAGVNGSLFTPALAEFFRSKDKYRDLTACVDLTVERTNRLQHEWVGGSMASLYYAAQDPITFTTSAYLDYLFETKFRSRLSESDVKYASDNEACTAYHFGTTPMAPFGPPLLNMDGLDPVYTDKFYQYSPSPATISCTANRAQGSKGGAPPSGTTCGSSSYLFCDRSTGSGTGRCVSKIRLGGQCGNFRQADMPCFRGVCYDGVCVPSAQASNDAPDSAQSRPKHARVTPTGRSAAQTEVSESPAEHSSADATEPLDDLPRVDRGESRRDSNDSRSGEDLSYVNADARRQTSEEDALAGSGRFPVNTRSRRPKPRPSPTPAASQPALPAPGAEPKRRLPDGRRQQTSEEDAGGNVMVLPHEEGKPAVFGNTDDSDNGDK